MFFKMNTAFYYDNRLRFYIYVYYKKIIVYENLQYHEQNI